MVDKHTSGKLPTLCTIGQHDGTWPASYCLHGTQKHTMNGARGAYWHTMLATLPCLHCILCVFLFVAFSTCWSTFFHFLAAYILVTRIRIQRLCCFFSFYLCLVSGAWRPFDISSSINTPLLVHPDTKSKKFELKLLIVQLMLRS